MPSVFTIAFFYAFCWGSPIAWARDAASRTAENLYEQSKKDYLNLIKSKERRAHREQWLSCIEKFKSVYETFPNAPQGYKAVYTVARLYHHLHRELGNPQDQDTALQYYRKVVSDFDSKRFADDALYHEGEIHLERKNYDAALETYRAILRNYPRGDQIEKAKKQVEEIQLLASRLPAPAVPPAVAAPVQENDRRALLQKVSYSAGPQVSQIVVQASAPVEIFQKRLSNPDRFYVNFNNSRLGESLTKQIDVNDEYVQRIRLNQFDKDIGRLVLDINPVKGLEVSARKEDSKVVIELRGPAPAVQPARAEPPLKVKAAPVIDRAVADRKDRAPLLIVLDPGHGGKDHGAQGESGLLEKNVNLEVSKRLKTILERQYKYRILLTREDDTFISLKERGTLANENDANLFVSIHANAAQRKAARGIETYYLGMGSSEHAKETAARENGELVKSVQDNQVQNILSDLIGTTKINDSSRLAGRVQRHLHSVMANKFSGIKSLGVKEGPFFVLHDANMPSILVEVGFITNGDEERRLGAPEYLDWLALSIARGIHDFLQEREPSI